MTIIILIIIRFASDVVFSNVTNITNNTKDSVYAQIVENDNNLYMIWQESVTQNSYENNYDIFLKKAMIMGIHLANQ